MQIAKFSFLNCFPLTHRMLYSSTRSWWLEIMRNGVIQCQMRKRPRRYHVRVVTRYLCFILWLSSSPAPFTTLHPPTLPRFNQMPQRILSSAPDARARACMYRFPIYIKWNRFSIINLHQILIDAIAHVHTASMNTEHKISEHKI